jgi:uncharacterized protein YbcC (UPF0753/DUF2309 family)
MSISSVQAGLARCGTGAADGLSSVEERHVGANPAPENSVKEPVPLAGGEEQAVEPRIRFQLDDAIDSISRWLPTQSPIKDFIHHNTLHALESRPFHEGIAIASRLYGARSYLPLADYQARYRSGRIHDFALAKAIAQVEPDPAERERLREDLFEDDHQAHYPPPSLALQGMRQTWLTHIELNLDAWVHPVLFRLISNYLDQGISRWSIARPDESLWDCLRRLVDGSFVPLFPFADPEARALVRLTPDAAIAACLARIVGDEALYGMYLLEMSLAHPGWSGMVRVVEKNPESLLTPRRVSLKEFLAVELAMELAFLNMKRGHRFQALAATPGMDHAPTFAEVLDNPRTPKNLRVWQEAMEFSLHAELLFGLQQQGRAQTAKPRIAQALFCIDDRECSLRRHLEEIQPRIETFGAAGFFGIDFFYKGLEDIYPVAQCPTVMTPRHLVVEAGSEKPAPKSESALVTARGGNARSRLMRNWVFTQTVGLGYAVKLAWDVFRPGAKLAGIRQLGEVDSQTRLHLLRQSDEPTPDGRLLGFSHAEMADRLEILFRNIGLSREFAPVVVVVAHGSTSTNNPHFAAYDCGACAGKPGAPNARAFAQMANDPAVRDLLRQRGIDIPVDTLFVAALHNTSRDDITYFDTQDWPSPVPGSLTEFQEAMNKALARNAHERCRWFELGPRSASESAALEHVRFRAASIFEPRPELNHSNNLYCIVGRRSLTSRLFLDRRAFLHSYDPESDSEGEILARILNQVIPVCGGINLEYLFSRIDNSMYGAGTKLPHNVIGLLGVANGMEGDLRTGLPSQMIEVHEPARLLIAVEQSTVVLDRAIARIGKLRQWLDHEWVRLASVHPASRDARLYVGGDWERIDLPLDFTTPAGHCSRDIYEGKTETLPVHRLLEDAA